MTDKVIIIIDEFDRIDKPEAKRLIADTIKNFSDNRAEKSWSKQNREQENQKTPAAA